MTERLTRSERNVCTAKGGGGNLPCDGLASRPGGSSSSPRHTWYALVNRYKLWPFGPLARVRLYPGAPNDNYRKNICSEDDSRSRIFETFVVKFLACLPLLGFSNI